MLRGFVLLSRSWRTVFLVCWCGPCRSCSQKISGQEWVAMVSKRSEGVRGSREKVLADAISIEGGEEWICKFCSESNVWTGWRCRRCYTNIPAGPRAKYRQADRRKSSTSSGEEGRSKRIHVSPHPTLQNIKKKILANPPAPALSIRATSLVTLLPSDHASGCWDSAKARASSSSPSQETSN